MLRYRIFYVYCRMTKPTQKNEYTLKTHDVQRTILPTWEIKMSQQMREQHETCMQDTAKRWRCGTGASNKCRQTSESQTKFVNKKWQERYATCGAWVTIAWMGSFQGEWMQPGVSRLFRDHTRKSHTCFLHHTLLCRASSIIRKPYWHLRPLLDNDHEISCNTTTVAK